MHRTHPTVFCYKHAQGVETLSGVKLFNYADCRRKGKLDKFQIILYKDMNIINASTELGQMVFSVLLFCGS